MTPTNPMPGEPAAMRVLQISKFYPPVMGGIETVTWELAEGLSRQGVKCDVLCSNQLPGTTIERPAVGPTVIRAGAWGRVLSTSLAPSMVAWLSRHGTSYDLIHVHMPDPMAAAALWLVRPPGLLVVHWHSDVIRQRRAMAFYRPLQDWLLRRADAIVATSAAYARASLALQPFLSKVHVIPIGISDCADQVQNLDVLRIRQRYGGRPIVFALGRAAYYKGFDVLVAADARLRRECAVVIGGDGEQHPALQSMVAAQSLRHRVHLPGPIPDHELASHYAASDLFCMPSIVRSEAYGVATVEAMCLGKPVVSSHIPGSGVSWVNVNGVTGLCVPAGDDVALARAIDDLLGDPPRLQRMGQAARQRYLSDLTAAAMVQRTKELYFHLQGEPAVTALPLNGRGN